MCRCQQYFKGLERPRITPNRFLTQSQPKRDPRQPKAPQGDPTGAPGRPKGVQRTAKGSPRAPQREPKEPKVGPKEAKGTPKGPKGSQRDKIYIKKLPINRPSGRYVIPYIYPIYRRLGGAQPGNRFVSCVRATRGVWMYRGSRSEILMASGPFPFSLLAPGCFPFSLMSAYVPFSPC